MIFAEKLGQLRKQNGWSQEELAEKLEVSRQTVSKWEGAQSVPDLERMLRLSELFGVTTDCLMKDDQALSLSAEERTEAVEADGAVPLPVSMEQAADYLRLRQWAAGRIALGVQLCILSPIALILLTGAADLGRVRLSESAAAGIGLMALIALVALAVSLFLHTGAGLRNYEDWETLPLDTAYGVDGMARDRREKEATLHTRRLILGVGLCVICPTPLFLMMALNPADWPMLLAAAALLVLVALGVRQLVLTGVRWESYDILLETGGHTRDRKRENRKNRTVAAIYWGLATAIYLGWSFLTNDWARTWILWPVAGVSYGVVETLLRAVRKKS